MSTPEFEIDNENVDEKSEAPLQRDVEILAIPVPLAQATVNYLATRPYQEVADLIGGLTSLDLVK